MSNYNFESNYFIPFENSGRLELEGRNYWKNN